MARRAPIPATSARLFGARSIPTSALTFNAKVTSRGARNSRQVPMYASVYREMKPQPTRCTAGASGAIAASAGDPYANPSPAMGGRCGSAVGSAPPGGETSGTVPSSRNTQPGDHGNTWQVNDQTAVSH